ncbi:MAG: hypothetical protein BWY47_00599 [Bacteroidetes bacterium ADurb.Bin302]|nr:MAG: hypothetical protein BWY47_00599 [Bacteroidetes bacterium ADurb.Bin302]
MYDAHSKSSGPISNLYFPILVSMAAILTFFIAGFTDVSNRSVVCSYSIPAVLENPKSSSTISF